MYGQDSDDTLGDASLVTNVVYVGSMSALTNEDRLHELFAEYGEVLSVHIKRTKDVPSYGFVKMADKDDAKAAVDGLNERMIDGKPLSVSKCERNTKLIVGKNNSSSLFF